MKLSEARRIASAALTERALSKMECDVAEILDPYLQSQGDRYVIADLRDELEHQYGRRAANLKREDGRTQSELDRLLRDLAKRGVIRLVAISNLSVADKHEINQALWQRTRRAVVRDSSSRRSARGAGYRDVWDYKGEVLFYIMRASGFDAWLERCRAE